MFWPMRSTGSLHIVLVAREIWQIFIFVNFKMFYVISVKILDLFGLEWLVGKIM